MKHLFSQYMTRHNTLRTTQGFTLIETLIAIFILALTIGALLTLTAGGFFSIRYAKNDIVASNLLQESLEYVRNTRDSASEQNKTWDDWLLEYRNANCSGSAGCAINPYAQSGDFVGECDPSCEPLSYYPDAGMYAYPSLSHVFDDGASAISTTFVRKVTFDERTNENGDPEVIVTARIDWKNGTNPKHLTQSILLTSWNLQL